MFIINISNYLLYPFDCLIISPRTILGFFAAQISIFCLIPLLLTPKLRNSAVNICRPDSVKIFKAPVRWLWPKITYLSA